MIIEFFLQTQTFGYQPSCTKARSCLVGIRIQSSCFRKQFIWHDI